MAKFVINFVRTHTYDCYYVVEADSEEVARDLAEEMVNEGWCQDRIDDHVVDWGEEYSVGEVYRDDTLDVGEFFNF